MVSDFLFQCHVSQSQAFVSLPDVTEQFTRLKLFKCCASWLQLTYRMTPENVGIRWCACGFCRLPHPTLELSNTAGMLVGVCAYCFVLGIFMQQDLWKYAFKTHLTWLKTATGNESHTYFVNKDNWSNTIMLIKHCWWVAPPIFLLSIVYIIESFY